MTTEADQFGAWQPWQPQEVARFFSALEIPWWVSGGWALDLFLGRTTRAHEDIDVQFLRRDQQLIRAHFQGWDMQEAGHPGKWPFREWKPGTALNPDIHDVWCRPSAAAPWAIQLMVADHRADQWVCRRDARICRPLITIGQRTDAGISYLAPEIQLLYKAKGLRPKDEADFATTLPFLDGARRQWLAQALALVHPGHPWLLQLEDGL